MKWSIFLLLSSTFFFYFLLLIQALGEKWHQFYKRYAPPPACYSTNSTKTCKKLKTPSMQTKPTHTHARTIKLRNKMQV